MTELIKLYKINQKKLLLNLINILKSTTKKCQKKEKEKKCSKLFYT